MEGKRGRFIVLEGIDGSGTTTQLDRVVGIVESLGFPATATQEPSRGPIGRLLRQALQGQLAMPDGSKMEGRTMALLFAADRRDHLQREIEPHLAAGTTVVSDRYLLSSLAYQAEEADRTWVTLLADGLPHPDLTILLDLPVAVAAQRRAAARRHTERYDADSYLTRVASNYRDLAKRDPSVAVINGAADRNQVTEAIRRILAAFFAANPC
ncbi:MAG: dTMP kinase [Polyangia bacterium]|jgi:dTMP kinase